MTTTTKPKRKTVALRDLVQDEEILTIRKVDPYVVSTYRQAMRTGAEFPPIHVDADMRVVSGNHRLAALIGEHGLDHTESVVVHTFADDIERMRFAVRENVNHGRQLDTWTKKKIAAWFRNHGEGEEKVSELLGIPAAKIVQWQDCGQVAVIGGGKKRWEPVKAKVTVPTGEMTNVQYAEHSRAGIGMSVTRLAQELFNRLENGWLDGDDEYEAMALSSLALALGRWAEGREDAA